MDPSFWSPIWPSLLWIPGVIENHRSCRLNQFLISELSKLRHPDRLLGLSVSTTDSWTVVWYFGNYAYLSSAGRGQPLSHSNQLSLISPNLLGFAHLHTTCLHGPSLMRRCQMRPKTDMAERTGIGNVVQFQIQENMMVQNLSDNERFQDRWHRRIPCRFWHRVFHLPKMLQKSLTSSKMENRGLCNWPFFSRMRENF